MHDLRWIREHPAKFDRGLMRRGLPPHSEQILGLDRAWRTAETAAQEAQARRNRVARASSEVLVVEKVDDRQQRPAESLIGLEQMMQVGA